MSTPTASSPLETVARNHGATMASRHGRRVHAHFGSVGAEEAVCLRAVGMADRSDRDTFELRGDPVAIETALTELGPLVWASFIGADRALVRCAAESTPEVSDVLGHYGDVAVKARTGAYAASSSSTSTVQTSPACRIRSTSRTCSATAGGQRFQNRGAWVSETTATRTT